jgi:hypothetical protein
MENVEFIAELGSLDFQSWMLVQEAYRDFCFKEEIQACGFNKQSGYVYIALENGIQIASCFGQAAEFIVYNFENGEELFFDWYEEAIECEYLN